MPYGWGVARRRDGQLSCRIDRARGGGARGLVDCIRRFAPNGDEDRMTSLDWYRNAIVIDGKGLLRDAARYTGNWRKHHGAVCLTDT